MKIHFGIDCAPGARRPNIYAERVFKRLGVEPVDVYSKMFGAWEWEVEVAETFDFKDFSMWMKKEMDKLYKHGHIRGATWNRLDTSDIDSLLKANSSMSEESKGISLQLEYKGYSANVKYDAKDEVFIGEVTGIKDSLSFHGSSVDEAKRMFLQCIDNYVDLLKTGKNIQ